MLRGFANSARQQRPKRILFYASEVAAAIGRNQFRSPAEVLPEVIFRCFPEKQDLLREHGIVTQRERADNLLKEVKVDDVVSEKLDKVDDIHDVEKLRLLTKDMEKEITKHAVFSGSTEKQNADKVAVQREVASRINRQFGSTQEDIAVGEIEKSATKDEVENIIASAVTNLNASPHVKSAIAAVATEQAKQMVDVDVTISTAGDILKETQQQAVVSAAVTAIQSGVESVGSQVDISARRDFEKVLSQVPKMVRKNIKKKVVVHGGNAKWYEFKLGHSVYSDPGYPFFIGGRVRFLS